MIAEIKALARNRLPAPVYGRIRAHRVRRFIATYPSRIVEHDYAGRALRLRLEDPLADEWYDHDWGEPAEITQLRKGRLREGAAVLNVGAHQGVVALILARIVGPAGSVVAVEAEPHNAAVADRNARLNDAGNLTVVHAAVGPRNGLLSFMEGLNGHVSPAGYPGAIEVRALTVDELVRRHGHPDVVLIDVEGFEAHVLEGAAQTIRRAETDFFVEMHNRTNLAAVGSAADDVVRHFVEGAYDVAIAVAGETPPGVDGSRLASGWRPAAERPHECGRRCFLVARGMGTGSV